MVVFEERTGALDLAHVEEERDEILLRHRDLDMIAAQQPLPDAEDAFVEFLGFLEPSLGVKHATEAADHRGDPGVLVAVALGENRQGLAQEGLGLVRLVAQTVEGPQAVQGHAHLVRLPASGSADLKSSSRKVDTFSARDKAASACWAIELRVSLQGLKRRITALGLQQA